MDVLYQTNDHRPWQRTGLPNNFIRVPMTPHGLNRYEEVTNAVRVATTNPTKSVMGWLERSTGMDKADLYQAYRIHSVYQFIGRTAIRNRLDARMKTLLVPGYEDAWFLHQLFTGSEWLGQIGSARSYDDQRKAEQSAGSLKAKPEYRKLRNRRKYLQRKVNKGTSTAADRLELKGTEAELGRMKQAKSATD